MMREVNFLLPQYEAERDNYFEQLKKYKADPFRQSKPNYAKLKRIALMFRQAMIEEEKELEVWRYRNERIKSRRCSLHQR